LSTLL